MRLTARIAALAMLAALVAACSPAMEAPQAVAARTSSLTLVQITEAGAGGLTAETAYGEKAIAAALPGFTTQGLQTASEDTTEWVIGAFSNDGFQVLQAFKGDGGRIREIHGVTHHLQGPNGERIGMTVSEVGTPKSACRAGRNLWRGMAICKARGSERVTLVYAVAQYQGPFDRLPPDDQFRGAALQRIIWSAR